MRYANINELILSEDACMDFLNSLPSGLRTRLLERDDIRTFEELEKAAEEIRSKEFVGEGIYDEK